MTELDAQTAIQQWPFPQATGRGLKIAVIDSGINLSHPHIHAKTYGVPTYGPDEDISFEDLLGHGTAVTAAIQEKAPGAEYYAVRLFGASLRATSNRLLQAIEWTIANKMDLVNLSLGTPNWDFQHQFELLVNRAAKSGTLLICARHENQRSLLPGMLEGVISVDVDWELPRCTYRVSSSERPHCFLASGFPRSLPGVAPSRNLHGVSFAVANMTGFVARACEMVGTTSLPAVCEALAAEVST